MSRDREFWTSDHRYEDLARQYEQAITRVHPNRVTSRRMCGCLKWGAGWCGWATTAVTYFEHRGPSVG